MVRSQMPKVITANPTNEIMQGSDSEFEENITTLAFGSCYNRHLAEKLEEEDESFNIWESVASIKPEAWLWLGDVIYLPKQKGDGSIESLKNEYSLMMSSSSRYKDFIGKLPIGVFGTWDDHDYGGNDRGKEMVNRSKRRDAFLDFLGNVSSKSSRRTREGTYSSVSFGTGEKKVKVIFLDTRWHRDRHILPSLAASHIPLGSVISCVTRFLTSFYFPSLIRNDKRQMLGEDQWKWLENQVINSDARLNIIVSSIQVFTTNPYVESWGHFYLERDRLTKLIRNLPGLIILSGDVHHAEFTSVGAKQQLLEVTSSGMTHSCEGPFYGPLCEPILRTFPAHRLDASLSGRNDEGTGFFTGKNFGSIQIDWIHGLFKINIYDHEGKVQMSTTRLLNTTSFLLEGEGGFMLGEGYKFPSYLFGLVGVFVILLCYISRKWHRLQYSCLYKKKRV